MWQVKEGAITSYIYPGTLLSVASHHSATGVGLLMAAAMNGALRLARANKLLQALLSRAVQAPNANATLRTSLSVLSCHQNSDTYGRGIGRTWA